MNQQGAFGNWEHRVSYKAEIRRVRSWLATCALACLDQAPLWAGNQEGLDPAALASPSP